MSSGAVAAVLQQLAWLRVRERVVLLIVLSGACALVGFNCYATALKYKESIASPLRLVSTRTLRSWPSIELFVCPTAFNLSRVECTREWYNADMSLNASSTVPCGVPLVVGSLSCSLIELPAPFPQLEVRRVVGVIDLCERTPTMCSAIPGYVTVAPLGFVRALDRSLGALDMSSFLAAKGVSVPFPTETLTAVTLSSERFIDLKKREVQTIRTVATGVVPWPGTTFALQLTPFSFLSEETVVTEAQSFDAWDALTSIAAVSSLAWSAFAFLFPNKALVPRYFVLGDKRTEAKFPWHQPHAACDLSEACTEAESGSSLGDSRSQLCDV
eukprot:Amastigsp_a342232_27.p1 type:complete len:328 gc:universal Amastigsp_a342232_27:1278-295(-)